MVPRSDAGDRRRQDTGGRIADVWPPVASGRQQFRGTADHRLSSSHSKDDAVPKVRSLGASLRSWTGPGVVAAPLLPFAIGGLGGGSVRTGAPRRRPGVSGRGCQCRSGAAPWRQARAGRPRSCRRGRCRCGRAAERRPWRPAQAFGSTWSPTPNRLGGRAESPSDERPCRLRLASASQSAS
jgi:hypothetical protein